MKSDAQCLHHGYETCRGYAGWAPIGDYTESPKFDNQIVNMTTRGAREE
jgi:hypothetical protein